MAAMFSSLSVGIDIGSSTTELVISELVFGKRDGLATRKPEILARRMMYSSPVIFTPFSGPHTIDAQALEDFARGQLSQAGVAAGSIDTGALICTGEAARKENAAAVSERLSLRAGRFVCATAGHHLEAVLGAHGSGAVELSRHRPDAPVVLLDVGGGTAKRTLLDRGTVVSTTAMNIGARLVVVDHGGRVCRLERPAIVIAHAHGLDLRMGDVLDAAARTMLASAMAQLLARFVYGDVVGDLPQCLLLTGAPPPMPPGALVMVAGGVAEYFYGRSEFEADDLGRPLAQELRRILDLDLSDGRLLDTGSGIRATVLGAGQFSVQVTGETVFHDGSVPLPLHGVPVRRVPIDWADVSEGAVTEAVTRALSGIPEDGPCALAFGGPPAFGYRTIRALAASLGASLQRLRPRGQHVLAFEQNIGRTVGESLVRAVPGLAVMCVDELELGDLDYLDVGEPGAARVLPVVVKSLVFA